MIDVRKKILILLSVATIWFPNARGAEVARTLSLDGTWQIAFDRNNEGKKNQWARNKTFPSDRQKNIAVPSCWELTEKDYEGVAFYRRAFTVPKKWEGKVIRLRFEAVNFLAEVWVNDQAVGAHEGGFTPFEFRVDKLLKFNEENTIILRVAGPILLQNKQVDGVGPMETPQWRGAITGGVWQSVSLVATDDVYVRDVFIEPKIDDDTATFHLDLTHGGEKSASAQVAITICSAGKPERVVATMSEKIDLKPGANKRSWALNIPNAKYWSPDNPNLYRAEVSVSYNDAISDLWSARFGMREFTVRDKQFCLNGKPMFLKATFFEGLYPTKLAYPDSREMAIREIQMAKDAGFNMIRPWRKPPPPMWLDLADEMGVLTVGSLVIECMDYPTESARLPGWVENEVRESILRDRNRACVVQWELFNELKRPVLKQLLRPMSMLARALDPTRMILDESGGWAQGANLYLPYESEPIKFNDIHYYPGPQINENIYNKLLLTGSKTDEQMRKAGLKGGLPGRNVIPGLMTVFSELGYGSLPDLESNNERFSEIGNPIAPPMVYHRRLADEHKQVLKESEFDKIYPNFRDFCLDQQKIHGVANKRMIEAVRRNPAVKGYCVHALTAGDWVMGAGLLDLFRNPKTYAYEGTKAANQPRIIPVRARPRNVYSAQGTEVEITGVNELDGVEGILKIAIVSENNKIVFTKEIDATLASGIAPLFKEKIDTAALQGRYTITARIIDKDGSVISENAHDFDVFTPEQLPVPENKIAVLDPGNSLKPFLKKSGIPFAEFDAATGRSLPVFVSRTEAKTKAERTLFDQLAKFIKAGGAAVYLQGGGTRSPWARAGAASELLPARVRIKPAIGLWLGISHIVRDHPLFEGLPVDAMMGSVYENVWATHALLDVEGETIVGSIGFDFAPGFELSKRHYYGPGAAWWGSDLAVVPIGKGRCVLSQLRLVENLGKDPVADKIFYNLIKYASNR